MLSLIDHIKMKGNSSALTYELFLGGPIIIEEEGPNFIIISNTL